MILDVGQIRGWCMAESKYRDGVSHGGMGGAKSWVTRQSDVCVQRCHASFCPGTSSTHADESKSCRSRLLPLSPSSKGHAWSRGGGSSSSSSSRLSLSLTHVNERSIPPSTIHAPHQQSHPSQSFHAVSTVFLSFSLAVCLSVCLSAGLFVVLVPSVRLALLPAELHGIKLSRNNQPTD
ncbi:hypothetical protein DFJ77DRAFT_45260 [Powellomyces hirtus]|nr:hypothetical protein DFJ77DRAFT_45260 [Powellomyces hirtus]